MGWDNRRESPRRKARRDRCAVRPCRHDPRGTEQIAHGTVYVKPLVSKYRAVVTAIETALQNWANNPNKTISVGELSITYKDRADLLDILAYYQRKATADENGTTPAGGVQILKVRFG